ncbi:MAG: hypothetical protein ACLR6B_09285 [Blautia sp.]
MLDRLDKLESDLTVISRLKPYAAVNIRNGVGYEEYLTEYAEYRHIFADGCFWRFFERASGGGEGV